MMKQISNIKRNDDAQLEKLKSNGGQHARHLRHLNACIKQKS